MEDNKHISDELLAKYLSGKASAEEEEWVLDYLAENDENLEDFLTMATAAKMQHQGDKLQRSIITTGLNGLPQQPLS